MQIMALAKACSFSFVPMYILYLLLQNLQSMNIIEKAFLQSCNSHFLKSLYKMCTYKLQLVIVCQKKMDSQINLEPSVQGSLMLGIL